MEKMLIRGLLINSFEENEEQKSRTDFLVYINSLFFTLTDLLFSNDNLALMNHHP